MAELPTRLWHLTYDAAVGFPEPTRRERKHRNYSDEAALGRQLATIERMPTHLKLISIAVTSEPIHWAPVDPATVPRPMEENDGGSPTTEPG